MYACSFTSSICLPGFIAGNGSLMDSQNLFKFAQLFLRLHFQLFPTPPPVIMMQTSSTNDLLQVGNSHVHLSHCLYQCLLHCCALMSLRKDLCLCLGWCASPCCCVMWPDNRKQTVSHQSCGRVFNLSVAAAPVFMRLLRFHLAPNIFNIKFLQREREIVRIQLHTIACGREHVTE